jgi:dipeptidase D
MQVIDIFKELCEIPHCSFHTEAMALHVKHEAQSNGYEVSIDAANNILCTTEGAVITLQAHYDMVCIGNAPMVEPYEKEGWLYAKESSLGADNGIAIAMMIALMREKAKVDFLFTADEEVGLIGARTLHVKLKTPYMLNLDSEEEATVTVGCAGGVDITARLPISYSFAEVATTSLHVKDLPGGHSGIDIDKNIPNAIKELLKTIESTQLCSISGGERRNSIAKSAKAEIVTAHGEKKRCQVINESVQILTLLRFAPHGVIKRCEDDSIMSSVNLATVGIENDELVIHLSARAMKKHELEILRENIIFYFRSHGCKVSDEGWYSPWEAESNEWSEKVASVIAEDCGAVRVETIHAGLECGVIKEQFPDIKMASIGPNIEAPHSIRERVEIASVARVYESVKRIIAL